jgi:hypothetical protein
MKHLWRALFSVLVIGAFMPSRSAAQGIGTQTGGGQGAGLQQLGQNFPNPVNLDTRIPFAVGDVQGCTDSGRQYRVNLRIYNLLAQLVAVPVLQGGVGNVAGGESLENQLLTCGQYVAYWTARIRRLEITWRRASLYRLEMMETVRQENDRPKIEV